MDFLRQNETDIGDNGRERRVRSAVNFGFSLALCICGFLAVPCLVIVNLLERKS